MVFLGYKTDSKAYNIYELVSKHMHFSCDIIVDEETCWIWEAPGKQPSSNFFTVE